MTSGAGHESSDANLPHQVGGDDHQPLARLIVFHGRAAPPIGEAKAPIQSPPTRPLN
jgi:hypothetical protein